jgi:hypothetical protein
MTAGTQPDPVFFINWAVGAGTLKQSHLVWARHSCLARIEFKNHRQECLFHSESAKKMRS